MVIPSQEESDKEANSEHWVMAVSQDEPEENQEQGEQGKKDKKLAVERLEEQGRKQVIALPRDELKGRGDQEHKKRANNKTRVNKRGQTGERLKGTR